MTFRRIASILGVAMAAFLLPFAAGATVKKDGDWPTKEHKVDLEFDGKPSDGLKQLAHEAQWSLVVPDTLGIDTNGANVHVQVENQPADAVLEALFAGRDVVAHRSGSLVTITAGNAAPAVPVPPPPPASPEPAAAPVPPEPPEPPAPPIPTVRGEDRSVFGGTMHIHPTDIVHTVTVTGGSAKIEGTVTGDLVIVGGSAKLAKTAHVIGNGTVLGGSLKMERGSRVDGDISISGGAVKREDGSIVGGKIIEDGSATHPENVGYSSRDADVEMPGHASGGRARLSEAVRSFGHAMTRTALLFVLGCVLLSLLAPRMEKLRLEVAARPMRSFALGLVASLVGSIGITILLVILCITVIGIPVAVFGLVVAVVAVYGSVASVLTTFGAAVAGHRTQNPYAHLLIGCAAFLVASSIPWLGGIVTAVVILVAVGALVATRAAGFLDRRPRLRSGLV